ncbi:MAG TPA: helix-turn-helix domain-containing protein [Vicinamibacterales bacterium]|nr:helix-turn-helix domain-containing protein [Vicinamibacterales bacterium]
MSDPFELGVLYTDHPALAAGTPLASLWSYESCVRSRRSSVRPQPHEYWLHRSDPLLNTMLPGTHVSVVVNLADPWATGRSLPSSSRLPAISVIGPFTWPQFLRVGRRVRAIGAVLPSVFSSDIFGVPAPALVNQIVPLADLWPREQVERLQAALSHRWLPEGLMVLRDALLARFAPAARLDTLERAAARLLAARGGGVPVDRLAAHYGISRQRFGRRFHEAAGLSPKLFARIVRFQGLVHSLLSTDVAQWAGVASDVGFYDQAHMINEFRGFAGAPPTVFFQPHDDSIDASRIQVRGRPSEWLR